MMPSHGNVRFLAVIVAASASVFISLTSRANIVVTASTPSAISTTVVRNNVDFSSVQMPNSATDQYGDSASASYVPISFQAASDANGSFMLTAGGSDVHSAHISSFGDVAEADVETHFTLTFTSDDPFADPSLPIAGYHLTGSSYGGGGVISPNHTGEGDAFSISGDVYSGSTIFAGTAAIDSSRINASYVTQNSGVSDASGSDGFNFTLTLTYPSGPDYGHPIPASSVTFVSPEPSGIAFCATLTAVALLRRRMSNGRHTPIAKSNIAPEI